MRFFELISTGARGCDPNFTYSDVQGGSATFYVSGTYTGTYPNNKDLDPSFTSPSAGAGTSFDGISADWSLPVTAACVDAGNSDTVGYNLPTTDSL